ncbi:MAG TPA: N-acetylglucosamine-6-phosphate deacetylase [Pyrinomonadaceae bacterium]|nr:N-acetylglucosamine-6-phosphate deacetylase [Pyrinomonadaceae bacterium]
MAFMREEKRTGRAERLILNGARVVLPGEVVEDACVIIERGRIVRVFDGPAPRRDGKRAITLDGLTLFPGFIDAHIHGAIGVDALAASADELHAVSLFLAARGVTAWLPTLVPAPEQDYRSAIGAIGQLMRAQDALAPAARAVGVHYEGPFVNERQCGALRTAYFRSFRELSDIDSLPTLDAEGASHMMTLAPEIEGGIELVRELAARGWVVSIGHTRAEVEVLEQARAAGARHMTHFLNAMAPLHHRAPGPIGWGLVRDDVSVDLIADGVHSDPLMLELVLRCKTGARVSLISDAVAPTGLGDGEYRVWGETIKVAGGRTSNERGSIAGSVITMRDAVRTVSALGVGEAEVARMASLNPARLLGIEHDCGSIEEGKRADLVALDTEGRVRLTLVGGRIAFEEK